MRKVVKEKLFQIVLLKNFKKTRFLVWGVKFLSSFYMDTQSGPSAASNKPNVIEFRSQ